ncbi:helix-turn-helix domain-containing protein [Brumimicrobium mesophilum]|uniref:helix-turn-helix domain-containing protein n=1 Tax=Brumimicrobium mesophilum TaxID=392717 RepID=UPI00131DAF9B
MNFADLFDLKRGTLGAYEEGRSEPKIETIINVANYFSIPIDDLLKRELTINELLKFNTELTTNESQLRKAFPRIPLLTKVNQEEYIIHHQKESFLNNMPFIKWPIDVGDKTYLFYEVFDLEMSDSQGGLYPKDIVLLEKISFENIDQSLPVLVVYDDIKLCRIVKKEEKVELIADHPAIETIEISISDIKESWVLVGLFQKYRKMENQSDLQTQINQLTKKVEDLES